MMTRSQTAYPSVTGVRAKLDLAALGKLLAQVSQLATKADAVHPGYGFLSERRRP